MAKKTLIIVIDALGYNLLKKTSLSSDLISRAVRLIPTWGFGESAVIWSGKLPQDTNRWNEFNYNPELSPFRWTRFLPLGFGDTFREKIPSSASPLFDFVPRKVMEFITAKISSSFLPYTYHIPLSKLKLFQQVHDWQTYQFESLKGNKTLFGIFKENRISYRYIGYPELRTDRDVYNQTRGAIKENEVTICFFFELDSIEHWQGENSLGVSRKLDELSNFINNLVILFRESNPQGNVVIFSDHGMTKVEKTIDVREKLKETGLRDGVDYLSFYDATMVRFWFFSQESKERIIDKLSRFGESRILQEAELIEAGLNFNGREFGELIFVVSPGTIVLPNYFQGRMRFQAAHGYCPPSRDEQGFFITDRDIELDDAMRMENVFNTLLRIIEVDSKSRI